MMSNLVCKTCRRPNPTFNCELCQDCICKNCTQFLPEGSFSYLRKKSDELNHSVYCVNCFDNNVSSKLADYEEKMEKAKDIIIFTKAQTKITRLLKRKAEPYVVENCEDEEEALMRMSFFAVEENYNAIIDVELKTKKIIRGSHKKTIWSASGVPMLIDPKKVRDENYDN